MLAPVAKSPASRGGFRTLLEDGEPIDRLGTGSSCEDMSDKMVVEEVNNA